MPAVKNPTNPLQKLSALTIPQVPLNISKAITNFKGELDYEQVSTYSAQLFRRFFSTAYSRVLTYIGIAYAIWFVAQLLTEWIVSIYKCQKLLNGNGDYGKEESMTEEEHVIRNDFPFTWRKKNWHYILVFITDF